MHNCLCKTKIQRYDWLQVVSKHKLMSILRLSNHSMPFFRILKRIMLLECPVFITPNRPQAEIFKNVIMSMTSVKSWCQQVYQKEREKQEEKIPGKISLYWT